MLVLEGNKGKQDTRSGASGQHTIDSYAINGLEIQSKSPLPSTIFEAVKMKGSQGLMHGMKTFCAKLSTLTHIPARSKDT